MVKLTATKEILFFGSKNCRDTAIHCKRLADRQDGHGSTLNTFSQQVFTHCKLYLVKAFSSQKFQTKIFVTEILQCDKADKAYSE